MTIRLILTYLLNLFDLAATTYWVNRFGVEAETNPIGRWLLETGLVYPVKIVGVAALLYALRLCIEKVPRMKWVGWLVLAAYVLLTMYHLAIIIQVALS